MKLPVRETLSLIDETQKRVPASHHQMARRTLPMKIAVCMKRVPDTATRLTFTADGQSVDTSEVQWVISPYDEFAIEEGLRIRERAGEGSVTVITIGPEGASKEIRQALGMGADDGVLAVCDEPLDPIQTARSLAAILADRADDVVLFGKQSVDSQGAQVGALVARLLDRPFVNDIAAIEVGDGQVRIERDVRRRTRDHRRAATDRGRRRQEPQRTSIPETQGHHAGEEEVDRQGHATSRRTVPPDHRRHSSCCKTRRSDRR